MRADTPSHIVDDQTEALAFLARPSAYAPGVNLVERIDTHGSIVFLAGERVYKVKRAVRYPYMDYGTLARRSACCEREVALNRRSAPELYLGVEPLARRADGRLSIGGKGEPVEWLVVMRRVPVGDLFDRRAAAGRLDDALIVDAADSLAALHRAAGPVRAGKEHGGGAEELRWVIADNTAGLDEHPKLFAAPEVRALASETLARRGALANMLDRRLAEGFVRHCHGDLHLGNLCLWNGRATLFDAIEFNDRFACIDVFYDLAFLLMELDRRVGRASANHLLNRYLRRTDDVAGVAGLPLFLSVRAAVRAKVNAAAASTQADEAKAKRLERAARAYFMAARAYLEPLPTRLIAVGGLSGSGKSTLARQLAPMIGAAPGALHLRSDVMRKQLFDVEDETRLPETAYAAEVSEAVYRRLRDAAGTALKAGHSVIVDAVFDREAARAAMSRVAREAGVPFDGVWLDVPVEAMRARLEARRRDASDATVAVLEQQRKHDPGRIDWIRLPAAGSADEVAARAAARLGLASGGTEADPDLRL